MVSLAAVEALAAEVWPGEPLGAAALPCPRKGQKVVLAVANPAATLDALRAHAREAGVAEIQLPSELRILDEIPVMASGKTDFPRLQAVPRGGSRLTAGARCPGPSRERDLRGMVCGEPGRIRTFGQ